jgi:hypothetical protein
MRLVMRTAFSLVLAVGASVALQSAPQTPQEIKPPATPTVSSDAPGQEFFAGDWDYNSDDSVDAATGRREQGPRSATQRRGLPGSGGVRSGPNPNNPYGGGGFGGGSGGSGGFGGGGGMMPGFGMVYVNPLRDLRRDLMEVPEAFRISVTTEAVTFTDDLDRERTYPTNGRKQKYQLGAAVFDAKVRWDGHQLKKEIVGEENFRMQETYFLSTDGNRLFVILRLGDPQRLEKNAPPDGVNRVYDRVR